ncbi:MAG: Gfo/Idh/MocA family protein [Bacteroidales bacterium]
MLKIGVLGAGHLGKIHLKCIQQIADYELVGFYDADLDTAKKVEEEFGLKSFSSLHELIELVDVVDIVTPTVSHFECASEALRKKKHVFIEKPIVASPEEARKLLVIAKEANVKVQVGHVERFNPAYLAAQSYLNGPMFIELHRLAQFNPRGCDVPVILDLMIHDIDIVLSAVKSPVKNIIANAVPIVSETPDIANARIEFENGAVANLTSSRISMKNMRKTRFFQKDTYISVDFLEKSVEVVRMDDVNPADADPLAMILDLGEGKASKKIEIEKPVVEPINAIKEELDSFRKSIINDTVPPVTIEDGIAALEVAYKIYDISMANLSQAK